MEISFKNYGITAEGVSKSDINSELFDLLLYSVLGTAVEGYEENVFLLVYDFNRTDGVIGSDEEFFNTVILTTDAHGKGGISITYANLNNWDDELFDAINGDIEDYIEEISADREVANSRVEGQVASFWDVKKIIQQLPFNTCSLFLGFFG